MLTYTLEKKEKESLYEQLYRFIREDILSGRLQTGERLPSKRMLAQHLEVSIITVQNAYEQLAAEGYLTGADPDSDGIPCWEDGCLFTIVQPVMLYQKAWKQKKQNEAINAVLHYCISEDGIIVSQGQQEAKVHWYEIRKTVKTKSALYLYMSQVRAFIFPKEQLADCYDEVCALVEERRAVYKDYEPTQEEQIDDTKHGE